MTNRVDLDTTALAYLTAPSFQILATGVDLGNTTWATITQDATYWAGGYRANTGGQNDEVRFGLPQQLQAGTWTLTFLARTASDKAIGTVATSPDGTTWTDLTTVDFYTVANTVAARVSVTGVTVPAGVRYLRVKLATKNASSSNYTASLSVITGVRTGA